MTKDKKIVEKIVDETIDTLVDKLHDLTTDYMFEYGKYEETNDEFLNDHRTYRELVIKELYKRLVETGVYQLHIR
tara:strand:+ start:175 stop:399 length:225 start_codon:yes stop_codon:yes gene_type:complete